MPGIDRYAWDVNGDLANDHVGYFPSLTVTYAAGTYTVAVAVLTADKREVPASRTLIVAVAPTVSATLTASTSHPDLSTPVTFTAAAATTGDTGGIASYAWDFDGNGTTDQTTAAGTATTTYTQIGAKKARVLVTSAHGQSATATTDVTVADAPIAVAVSGGPGTVGVPIAVTAAVLTSGTAPASVTYSFDYQNDGTVDEVVTGGATKAINVTYNTAGAKTIKVTVTAADGRTATSTLTMAVS